MRNQWFADPPRSQEQSLMEYPLILRTQDGSACITVYNIEQEESAAPTYRRRAAWASEPPLEAPQTTDQDTAEDAPKKRGRPKKEAE